ncbi:MAG TPA: transporter [Deltaproteobacteria bacterium]|nr:transporter [Deltaproteobacteria bacterium]HQI01863.1 transporter [Deltaproteobacteria bacterium]
MIYMTEILSILLNVAVPAFSVTSMLSVGFGHMVQEIFEPFSSPRSVIVPLLANFVLVPLLGAAVIWFFSLDRPLENGLILFSASAGAPFLIKLTQFAKHDMALSAALLVLLLPATVIYMPIVVPLMLPEAEVSAGAIAVPLMLTMLLPLGVGLFVRSRSARWAMRLQPVMGKVSTISLVMLVGTTILLNLRAILDLLGTGAVLAAAFVIIGAFVIGYVLGGARYERRCALGLGTAQRGIAAAMVVAAESFGNPDTLVMVVVSSLVGLAILFPIASVLSRHAAEHT